MRKTFDYIMYAEVTKYDPMGSGELISYGKNIVGYYRLKDRVNLCEKTMRPRDSNAFYWDDFVQIVIYDGAKPALYIFGKQKKHGGKT